MTYTWLNPPPGTYSTTEYLKMVKYWRDSTSASRNKLQVPLDPMKNNFFGTTKVTIVNEFIVKLEAI